MTEKKVMCFGTFDGLHPGHLSYFRQAKKYGDYLIVVIARDSNVLRFKKHSPKFSENERLLAVKNANLADEVVLGDKDDIYKVIKEKKPEAVCLGYDQKADEDKIKTAGSAVRILRLKPFQPDKFKSSIINLQS
ncbi:MAG: adenylyltransferase/cytidyltransferase family protein [bacterium]|nr:adenylyltransferase/cytidyltransferase family protein [bacterium]